MRGEMEMLARLRAAEREIDVGVATTRAERAAVSVQRFRVYRRWGYYRPGLRIDHELHDDGAIVFLATLRGGADDGRLVGSARLVLGQPRPGFRFPAQEAFEFDLPAEIRDVPVTRCHEMGRLVSEPPAGFPLGTLVTPLGLVQAVSLYSQQRGVRCGLGVIKRRLVRALVGLGVRVHEIAGARLVYPRTGVIAGYFYRHPDPPVPVYWLDDIVPSIERAIACYETARSTQAARSAVLA